MENRPMFVGWAACSIFVLATACSGPIRATISPGQLYDRVRDAEDRRDANADAVARALGRQEKSLRIAGLSALARTEAVGTSSLARKLALDPDPDVATWAAFALGQIGDRSATATLLTALDANLSPVPEQLIYALGRAGTATTARVLMPRLRDERPAVRGAAALAIGLIAKRHNEAIGPAPFEAALQPLLFDADRNVRFGAAYALMRIASPGAAVALIRILADPDAEIRATAARGLGLATAAPQVLDAVMSDPDWRVQVEVARALGSIGAQSESDAPAAAIRLSALGTKSFARFKRGDALTSGRATHVLLAVADAAAKIPISGRRTLDALDAAPWDLEGLTEGSIPDVARVQCSVAFHLDRLEREVKRVRTCGKPTFPEWRRQVLVAKLLAERGGARSIESLATLAQGQDPKVRAAAIEALGEVEDPASSRALLPFLQSNDPYVASATAEILTRPTRVGERTAALTAALGTALDRTLADGDASLVVLVLDAIAALGPDGAPFVDRLIALDADRRAAVRRRAAKARSAITGQLVHFSAADVAPEGARAPITERVRLLFTTVRGEIEVELYGDVAPHATGTLVGLAADGFYDDLTFHRIVSNFVAQGGCPRGDGWGGPGFVIPDETSPLPFVRGAVGIATNGRDTGGSQFFFMQAHHPHLEGGYALVGRVVRGIEVADALQTDDRILSVQRLASAP